MLRCHDQVNAMKSDKSLRELIAHSPGVFDATAVERVRDALGSTYQHLQDNERCLVDGVAGCSPYLSRLILRNPGSLHDILHTPPSVAMVSACDAARAITQLSDQPAQMAGLRRAKDQAALTVALADISGAWDVMTATRAISEFADASLGAAFDAAANRLAEDTKTTGICVLAMGKHGAHELNYSSDIDIVVLFDPVRMGGRDYADAQQLAIKITREAVNLMHQQTADGYVFRTDLRLRPDPGATAVALSVGAAEAYYEAYGQNWERMAYIKARPAAGDIALGQSFLQSLRPFVWRKYLDYAAIDDVKAVKRQIHSSKGGGDIEFAGHDIKLGRGGIREIEFYAQTQQLILGGKNPPLRQPATLDALDALCRAGQVSDKAKEELSDAYRYLRCVEHRLQMVNDEQTHTIPKAASDIERIACFLGEPSKDAFKQKLTTTLDCVKRHFDALFEDAESTSIVSGSLVFTGVSSDPATIETLENLGFQRAEDISGVIRRWHAGGIRATRTERARVLLTRLMPPLLDALSKASSPDDAFFAFDDFIKRLPGGVQVFSLLVSNTALFDTLIRIMTISPFLGRQLSRRINAIERLLDNSWMRAVPVDDYAPALRGALVDTGDYEEILNRVRRWAGEQKFLTGAQLAIGVLPADEAAARFTAIATACIHELCTAVIDEMQRQHGKIDGEFCVVALGRLGAAEMTAMSDVDLVFVYEAAPTAMSDGARSLGPVDYYTRLVRRFVTSLSAATQEGVLYEVDMQLRPSGGAGPTAVSFAAFQRYYSDDAWTWEMMALTKARVIAGSSTFGAKVDGEIEAALCRSRDAETVATEIRDMRRRLLDAKPGRGLWDVKHVTGGLTDIAFIGQYFALIRAKEDGRPPGVIRAVIDWLEKNQVMSTADVSTLRDAHIVFEAVLHTGRAATGGVFDPETAGPALTARMAEACGAETIEKASTILTKHQSMVIKIYHKVLNMGTEVGDN